MAVVAIAFLIIGFILPVLPLHVHIGLGLSTFVVGLVTGVNFWRLCYHAYGRANLPIAAGPSAPSSWDWWPQLFPERSISFLYASRACRVASVSVLLAGRALLGAAESFIITGAATWGLGVAGPERRPRHRLDRHGNVRRDGCRRADRHEPLRRRRICRCRSRAEFHC